MTQNPEQDAFKQRDARSYDAVTDSFDRYTERCALPMARRIVELLHLVEDAQVLDVATGTGVVALEIAGRLGSAGRLTGIDLSTGMLEFVRGKAIERRVDERTRFLEMDAESLEFPDRSFDAVVSLYALRHFPDPLRALREMRRVLRPGGELIVGVGSGPPLLSWHGLRQACRKMPDVLQQLAGRQLVACRFLEDLVEKHLPAAQRREEAPWLHDSPQMQSSVTRMVAAAGFSPVRSDWIGERTVLQTADEFWELQMTFSSLARKRVAEAPPEAVADLRKEFDTACLDVLAAGGRLVYPTGALLVSGRA
jgi:ubiquinone/menaquinone biosynthesis C-methylase UbiE